VQLDETLFDMDGPGHYFRRIKHVAVSLPCVVGPYASVNCTLTLLKSTIRTLPILSRGTYPREDAADKRFSDDFGSLQSIVTSSATSDAGIFEPGAGDGRYLPFENAGAISEWSLQLPADPSKGGPQQFDYGSISDVILHIRYTAREGGSLLRGAAIDHLSEELKNGRAVGSRRLFSVRHDFPTEWARFVNAEPGSPAELTLPLRQEHYPFWSPKGLSVAHVDLLARMRDGFNASRIVVFDKAVDEPPDTQKRDELKPDPSLGRLLFRGSLKQIALPLALGRCTLFFEHRRMEDTMEDLWLRLDAKSTGTS
jgi:hypothetical protein